MGTRSIIAIPDGDTYKGRYCHFDGYPTHMGHALMEIVGRDGLDTAITNLVTEPKLGWSYISPTQPVLDRSNCNPASPAYSQYFGPNATHAAREGYGCERLQPYPPENDIWHGPDSNLWQEWVYVLRPEGLEIISIHDGSLGTFAWGEVHHFAMLDDPADEEVA